MTRQEIERMIIGSILWECDAGGAGLDTIDLAESEIQDHELRDIFAGMLKHKGPVKSISLADSLPDKHALTIATLTDYAVIAPRDGSMQPWVDILRERNYQEEIKLLHQTVASELVAGEITADEARTTLESLELKKPKTTEYKNSRQIADRFWEWLQRIKDGDSTIGTGTSLAVAIAAGMAKENFGVLFASVEMTDVTLAGRLLSKIAGVPIFRTMGDDSQKRSDDWDKLTSATKELAEGFPFYLTTEPDLQAICNMARKAQIRHDIKAVFVDYIGLLDLERAATREQQIAMASKKLNRLAKSTGLIVYALSQLNRKLTDRADKRPFISDLRESGSLEQDADQIWLLHRDIDSTDPLELSISKNRNGPAGRIINLDFRGGNVG